MSENYIVIDGKKTELTEEQLKALGIEPEKKRNNPFERVAKYRMYSYVSSRGQILTETDDQTISDDENYNDVNYFNDRQFAKQVALHQLLYRKLLKFAYDNECEDTAEWDNLCGHFHIFYDTNSDRFYIESNDAFKYQGVYFSTKTGAERAIKEVIEPFMKEHPDFVW